MEHLYPLLKSVTIFFLLVLFIQLLKRQGIFNDSNQPLFNRFVTELALTVVIFSTLAVSRVHTDQILAAVVMFASIAACCFLASIAYRAMKLSYGKTEGAYHARRHRQHLDHALSSGRPSAQTARHWRSVSSSGISGPALRVARSGSARHVRE